jgi:hypothetical protein
MAWYQSRLPNDPPGVQMPKVVSPYQYPGANEDIVRSMGQGAQARQQLAAEQANANYSLQQQEQARNLVLGGLTQQNQGMQNQQQLATNRLGILSSLLANVYR